MAPSNTTTTPPPPLICDKSTSPNLSTLTIPQDINVVYTPGNDTSWPGMVVCCAPNQVQTANRCQLWCEVPRRYFNGTDRKGAESDVMDCVLRNANDGGGRIVATEFNAAPPAMRRVGVRGVGMWVLALSGVVWAM